MQNDPKKTGVGIQPQPSGPTALSEAEGGVIPHCPHQNCGFRCCEFNQGNYIVLYPGELEAAQKRSESVKHLEILELDNGGYKAVCRAQDTSCCDSGYKPLDCQSYPFFPSINPLTQRIVAGTKGKKCPLSLAMITEHREWVLRSWDHLAQERPEIVAWLKKVKLVGYEQVADQ